MLSGCGATRGVAFRHHARHPPRSTTTNPETARRAPRACVPTAPATPNPQIPGQNLPHPRDHALRSRRPWLVRRNAPQNAPQNARPRAEPRDDPRTPRRTAEAADTPAWAALNNRGNNRQESGDIEGAIDDFTAAIELAPDEIAPRYNRGNARSLEGDLDGAIADYSDAIALDPTFAPAFQRRGLTRQRKGDAAAALADLDEAVRLAPDEPSALGERAALRALRADFEGAVRDCELALSIAPKGWKHRKGTEHLLETIRKAEAAHVAREDMSHEGHDHDDKKGKKPKKTGKKTSPKIKKHAEPEPPAAIVEEVLEGAGWSFQTVEDDEGYVDFVTMVEGDPLVEATVVRLSEELERLVLYVLLRPKAKKERRAEVAELVTRANYGMGDGNFEMDVDDGAVRFKIALDFTGMPLSPLLVRNMILDAMDTLEVYEGAFLRVFAGKAKAKAAVLAAEKAAEEAGDFS